MRLVQLPHCCCHFCCGIWDFGIQRNTQPVVSPVWKGSSSPGAAVGVHPSAPGDCPDPRAPPALPGAGFAASPRYSCPAPTSTFPHVQVASAAIPALGGCLPSPAAFSLHLNRNVSFPKQFTFPIPEVSACQSHQYLSHFKCIYMLMQTGSPARTHREISPFLLGLQTTAIKHPLDLSP